MTTAELNQDARRVYGVLEAKLASGDKPGEGSWQDWCRLAEAHAKLCESQNCPDGARAARHMIDYYTTGTKPAYAVYP